MKLTSNETEKKTLIRREKKIKEGRKERKKEERKGQKDQLAACILAGVHVICTRLSKHCCQSDGPSFHS